MLEAETLAVLIRDETRRRIDRRRDDRRGREGLRLQVVFHDCERATLLLIYLALHPLPAADQFFSSSERMPPPPSIYISLSLVEFRRRGCLCWPLGKPKRKKSFRRFFKTRSLAPGFLAT